MFFSEFSTLTCPSWVALHGMAHSFIEVEHSLALPFFVIGMKTDFSNPVATAEFSKFAGILSATLSQHHLLGFEIAQPKFHHLH